MQPSMALGQRNTQEAHAANLSSLHLLTKHDTAKSGGREARFLVQDVHASWKKPRVILRRDVRCACEFRRMQVAATTSDDINPA